MNFVSRFTKMSTILSLILLYCGQSVVLSLRHRSRWNRTRSRALLAQRYSRWALAILGVRVSVSGEVPTASRSGLLVGNHLSYLDVLVMASLRPTCFVTSQDMRETIGLGWLCELGGCLFVDRRSRARLDVEVSEITEALSEGLDVTIFPEATSTDGSSVLRFRRPLFKAAVKAEKRIFPFCLNYRKADGVHVCWYGDMQFLAHLWSLTDRAEIGLEVIWTQSLETQNGLGDALSTAELAEKAHALVVACFRPLSAATAPSGHPSWTQSPPFPSLAP